MTYLNTFTSQKQSDLELGKRTDALGEKKIIGFILHFLINNTILLKISPNDARTYGIHFQSQNSGDRIRQFSVSMST